MTSGCVFAIALLFTSLVAFGQQSSDPAKAPEIQPNKQVEIAEAAPGILSPVVAGPSFLPPMQAPSNVNVCFKMRSYVVARDSKDSDSTHLVRYSTCTPANNRGVQKVARPPADR